IQRKHLKLVLLDLYVAYLEHPDLKLAVSMREGDYRARGSRYNVLNISKNTITAVNLLADACLIEMKLGYFVRSTGQGKRTRIWPSSELVDLFKKCQLDSYKVGRAKDEEVIILRNANG